MNGRSQSIFLINNYDYLVSHLEVARSRFPSKEKILLSDLIHFYDTKLSDLVDLFATEELKPYFTLLFEFIDNKELGTADEDSSKMTMIIEDFNDHVQERIKALSSSLLQLFSNNRTTLFVANIIFTQLLTAYKRFLDTFDELEGKMPQRTDLPLPMALHSLEQFIHQATSIRRSFSLK